MPRKSMENLIIERNAGTFALYEAFEDWAKVHLKFEPSRDRYRKAFETFKAPGDEEAS